MRYLSLFSGIEAASVAWLPLGWTCVAVAEIERFPCQVLKHHYPEVPNLGDVTKITQQQIESLGQIDVVIFGFPCQDLSQAGQRKGLKHADGTLTRSGLFFYAEQISRWAKARWTVAENVPGLFSSNQGRDFATVVGELVGAEFGIPADGWRTAGFANGPRGLAEWRTMDAQFFGLAQRRKRVFIVRDSGDWTNRPPLFFESPGSIWNNPPSRKARERTSPTLESGIGRSGIPNDFHLGGGLHEISPVIGASGRGFSRGGDSRGQDAVIPVQEIAPTLRSGATNGGRGHGARSGDSKDELIVPVGFQNTGQGYWSESETGQSVRASKGAGAYESNVVAHALKAEGHDGSEDGTGRGVPLVPEVSPTLRAGGNQTGGDRPPGTDVDTCESLVPEVAWALQERDSKGSDSSTKDGHLIPVAYRSSGNCGVMEQGDKTAALNTNTDQTQQIVAFHENQRSEISTSAIAGSLNTGGGKPGQGYPSVAMAFEPGSIARNAGPRGESETVSTLRSEMGDNQPAVRTNTAVRRLTVKECLRLQGFPDDYLKIHDKVADGPCYKAIGNSFAVPCIEWLGRRIELIDKIK